MQSLWKGEARGEKTPCCLANVALELSEPDARSTKLLRSLVFIGLDQEWCILPLHNYFPVEVVGDIGIALNMCQGHLTSFQGLRFPKWLSIKQLLAFIHIFWLQEVHEHVAKVCSS